MRGADRREQEIFHQCLAMPPGRRPACLKADCGGDAELLFRVERLLAAHSRAERAEEYELDRIAGVLLTEAGEIPGDDAERRVGDAIGAWRLVRKIGEGGMASVWLAERSEERRGPPVAIKLPLGGSPKRILVERMARERELLVALNHPNIARLWRRG